MVLQLVDYHTVEVQGLEGRQATIGDVGTRAEVGAIAQEDQGEIWVLLKSLIQFVQHFYREAVVHPWTIEGDTDS